MARMLSKTFALIVLTWLRVTLATYGSNETKTMPRMDQSLLGDVWQEGLDVIRVLWKDCSTKVFVKSEDDAKKEHFGSLVKCVKRKTLRALDRTLSSDVIFLTPGVQLVKYEIVGNGTKNDRNESQKGRNEADYENGDWKYQVLDRMAKVFSTHVLKLSLQDMEGEAKITESRHRRRHHMVQMMMFGIVSMGMILIPMGFQFLAVLGGKALLLAKLALILSSIQGLKKIATSPLNYGLYHVDGHIEKRGLDQSEWKLPSSKKLNEIEDVKDSSQEKIKYRYDSESRLWKPESPVKRSLYGIGNGQNVYTVYPISPHAVPSHGYFGSSGYGIDGYNQGPPGDIHAEYTIDLPFKPF